MPINNTNNIFVLLLIAVITGFLLPTLAKTFEIIFTRRIAKKIDIRNKQLEIIDELTKIIWEWRFLGKQVCYYGCNYVNSVENAVRFQQSILDYEKRVWTIFTEIKAIKSRSMVWYPKQIVDEIEEIYEYIKSDVDVPLSELMFKSANKKLNLEKDFYALQAFFSDEVTPRIEKHIQSIASTISKA
jgi:hypothetical protein